MESRRAFLGRCGAGAAVWTALGTGGWSRPGRPRPPSSTSAGSASWRRSRSSGPRRPGRRTPISASTAIAARTSASASRPTARRASRSRCRRSPIRDRSASGFACWPTAPGGSRPRTKSRARPSPAPPARPSRSPGPTPRCAAEPIQLARDTGLPRHLPDQGRHRSVLGPDRAEARAAARRRRRSAQGRRGVLGDGLDRRPPRRPVLRLVRGERDRAARLPDLTRVHGDGRRGRPQGQVAAPTGRTRSAPATRRSSGPTCSATPAGSAKRRSRT